jgi:dihydrofolate synthase / folylpolyglutamate synthase
MTDDAPMTLDAWLARLEAAHPVGIDLGLDRVSKVAERMGLLQAPIAERVITVAGTNGKGSTVAMLESLALKHGLSVAAYTSPHLIRYNERLRLDGVEADDELLMAGFAAVEQARLQQEPVSLTYFEVGTLGALWAIAQSRPQLAVLEVGLGGRLDAVNVIDPNVAVVTTVAQDHAAFLGNDIQVIGREKAGIMRSDRPAVLGSQTLPRSVHEHAAQIGARVHALGQDFNHQGKETWAWRGRDASQAQIELVDLPDPHLPRDNAATALQAFVLCDIAVQADACRRAFAEVQLAGRMQWHGQWCLDVGHNPHAAEYLARRLGECSGLRGSGRLLALLGMLDDKDAEGVMAALASVVDAWVTVSLSGERGRSAEDLAQRLEHRGLTVLHCADDPLAGAEWLEAHMEEQDQVLVTGSFLTVGAILQQWQTEAGERPASIEGAR